MISKSKKKKEKKKKKNIKNRSLSLIKQSFLLLLAWVTLRDVTFIGILFNNVIFL